MELGGAPPAFGMQDGSALWQRLCFVPETKRLTVHEGLWGEEVQVGKSQQLPLPFFPENRLKLVCSLLHAQSRGNTSFVSN